MKRKEARTLIDLTPVISSRLAVFPGDTVFQREVLMDTTKGDHLGLSWVKTTLHLGAHADATNHYHSQGRGIEQRDLLDYYGPCQVIHVLGKKPSDRLYPVDLRGVQIECPRVLFRTDSFPDPENWNPDFNSLSPELIHFLHEHGVRLVGIDTPSVDPQDSKKLESHQALFETGMAVLEGIVLTAAAAGFYTLAAFPLRIENADASPVRAVLISEQ